MEAPLRLSLPEPASVKQTRPGAHSSTRRFSPRREGSNPEYVIGLAWRTTPTLPGGPSATAAASERQRPAVLATLGPHPLAGGPRLGARRERSAEHAMERALAGHLDGSRRLQLE